VSLSEPNKVSENHRFLWVHFQAIAACILVNLSIPAFFDYLLAKEPYGNCSGSKRNKSEKGPGIP
jgi:hypothetical protein